MVKKKKKILQTQNPKINPNISWRVEIVFEKWHIKAPCPISAATKGFIKHVALVRHNLYPIKRCVQTKPVHNF